jgi:hypothetical protein
MFRVGFELGAEGDDVVVDGASGRESGVTPDDIEEPFTRDRLAVRVGQQPEHGELARGEVDGDASARGGLPRQIDADRAQGQMPDGFACLPGATEQGADAGQQFAGAERFDQVIVGGAR